MKLSRALSFAVTSTLITSSLAGCEELQNPRREALQSLTDNAILPLLQDFEDTSSALSDDASELCDAPNAERLDKAREAWSDTRSVWKRAEVLSFGPHTLAPWHLARSIDFWPERPEDVEAVLNGDVSVSGDDALSEVGGAARGFGAIEYLLFTSDDDADAFASGDLAERRCDYLIATTADLNANARALHAAWADDFAGDFAQQNGEHYAHLDDAFSDLVNNLAFSVEVVRDDKIGRPLGRKTDGEPQPDLVESKFSGRSINDSIDVLRGIEDMFDGGYKSRSGKGLSFVLSERHHAMDAQVDEQLQNAEGALQAIDGRLDDAVVNDPESVEGAMTALHDLLVYLQVDIAQALGVTVTFGGADGD